MNSYCSIEQKLRDCFELDLKNKQAVLREALVTNNDFSAEKRGGCLREARIQELKKSLNHKTQQLSRQAGHLDEQVNTIIEILCAGGIVIQAIEKLLKDLEVQEEFSLLRNQITALNESLEFQSEKLKIFNISIQKDIEGDMQDKDILKKQLKIILAEQKELQQKMIGAHSYRYILGYSALAGLVIGALGAGLTCLLSSSAFTSAVSFLGLAALHPVLAIGVVAIAMTLVFSALSYLGCKGMEYVNSSSGHYKMAT